MLHHAYYHHSYGMGSWVAHTIARGMLYRVVDAATRGMGLPALILLVLGALAVVWFVRRA